MGSWQEFKRALVVREFSNRDTKKFILIMRGDFKCFAGELVEITDHDCTIHNGHDVEIIRFGQPMRFTKIEPPGRGGFTLADRQFSFI